MMCVALEHLSTPWAVSRTQSLMNIVYIRDSKPQVLL